MQKPVVSDSLKKARAEAAWGIFVADALAMPAHWFYDPEDIVTCYGSWITGYVAPADKHPSSILTVSDVGMCEVVCSCLSSFLICSFIISDIV